METHIPALPWAMAAVGVLFSACQSGVPLCESVYVSTLAGNGTTGYLDGTGGPKGTAEFIGPFGIVLDNQGNAYVADLEDNHVRVIDPAGNVSSLVVQGAPCPVNEPSGDPQLCGPWSIALDPSGTFSLIGRLLQEIDPAGNVTTMGVAGSSQGANWGAGPVSSAAFGGSNEAVASDSLGNIYVSDLTEVRRIDAQGNVTVFAGGAGAVSASGTPNLTGELTAVAAIAVDSRNNVYVADGNSIKKIDSSGTVSLFAGNGAPGYVDGSGGPDGTAEFNSPQGLAVDSQRNVFVSDTGNNRIRKISSSGTVTTVAGASPVDMGGYFDGTGGPGGSAQFNEPAGIAVDAQDNLYVADFGNDRVRFIPQCQ